MHKSEKKQRIRNRPRNKANRLAAEVPATATTTTALSNSNSNVPVNATTTKQDNSLAFNLKDLLQKQNNANDSNTITVNKEHNSQTTATAEQQQTIQLIQQLIRNKLLKKQQQEQQQRKVTVKEEAAVTALAEEKERKQKPNSSTKTKAGEQPKPATTAKTTTTTTNGTVAPASADAPLPPAKQAILNKIKQAKALREALKDNTNENVANAGAGIDKNLFLNHLQKKVENSKSNNELPAALLSNLQKLLEQEPISDVESSDDEEEEYIEYIYKPRPYFVVSLCNLCKCDLIPAPPADGEALVSQQKLQQQSKFLPCSSCHMTYYCSKEHMKNDKAHRQICWAIRQVADGTNGHIFYKCGSFSTEQFRSYRIVNIKKIESVMNRPLTATEQEIILFPRICNNIKCREYRFERLADCQDCGQVAYCKQQPDHLSDKHKHWCKAFRLFKEYIMFQEKFGRLDPSLPSKILKDLPMACTNTKQLLKRFGFDMQDACEYAALTQISTGPLSAWYALKLCEQLKCNSSITIHLIGAEIEFEVDALHKWELFFLHITPAVKELNIVFVGPELNPNNISFDQLKRTKCCRCCRKAERSINYHFENKIYHDYCASKEYIKPSLVCFFNAGLYRSTGYLFEDTWPETILATANAKCPVIVTSYTQYEAPLDLARFIQESNRRLNIVLPPIVNPFASEKPERNFISDDEAPIMFKNYYCFVVE